VTRSAFGTGALLALALGAASASSPAAQAAPCLQYEPEPVRLVGHLDLKVFAGPPHYRSVETGDRPESVWMLRPASPVCVDAIADDAWSIGWDNVPMIEIVARTSIPLSLNGKAVQVEGTVFRARSGHTHAQIQLRATRVAPE